ncbi:hypothetical protein DTO013E5_136 [Penicillium roqueforti]|uniref:uncharacterized protein n=2 Tax=Penicillium TaxID=5073 RepID=UPI00190CEAC0|nr:uncharacterized protein LCP9604111_1001 [Penicillium roqueforti]KAF9253475.1 hypothetical protein LCP9604111_1001 [Penicillium roqueforti]KAI1838992.1 hypothetical protein CBS147337_717 [Penicillium roqueforti]KAI2681912.1 hypothetical protein CBS147355_3122 [Penicillium roqueforti]KAI2691469.1 hypothetical protein LCP963914a_1670 [Penicillium roqueforti]KAI2706514.1 hypothetical protein CBS147372_425 [Penicillium roqueforti]
MSELLKYILTHEEAFRRNRLPSLYSDFTPQKKTNPDGYAVNVAAWEHALNRAAKRGYTSSRGVRVRSGSTISAESGAPLKRKKTDHLILRTDESLLRDLESPEWGRPAALGTVFDEAVRKNSMIPLPIYKTTAGLLQKKSQWKLIDPGVLSPWNVMSWGARQLKGFVVGSDSDSAPKLQVQELVLIENLQEAADLAVKKATGGKSSKLDLIYSREMFVEEFAAILNEATELSDADFDVLLLYLSRDSSAIAYDGKTIKFKSADESAEITQQDTTIASIKTLQLTMLKQVTSLKAKIAELTASAKTALANKNRISALSAVRSRKMAEKNLQDRTTTLIQLDEVYSKIEQAADQVEMVRIMKSSTGVLRSLHTQIGGAERVEDIVEELREEMAKVDEVGSVMNEAGPVIDEGEIDDELAAMETSEREALVESRLAELDSVKQASDEASRRARAAEDADSALADNIIDRLSNMSVEDRPMQAN